MSRRQAAAAAHDQPADPFRELGLPRSADLTDDQVRAAWRQAAAATHPDRADGGDPAAFASAAAAYASLRTPAARASALDDPPDHADQSAAQPRSGPGWRCRPIAALAARIWRGRPGMLAARVLATIAVPVLAVAAVGWQPASAAVITGMLTWLVLTGRLDLAPQQPPRQPNHRRAQD